MPHVRERPGAPARPLLALPPREPDPDTPPAFTCVGLRRVSSGPSTSGTSLTRPGSITHPACPLLALPLPEPDPDTSPAFTCVGLRRASSGPCVSGSRTGCGFRLSAHGWAKRPFSAHTWAPAPMYYCCCCCFPYWPGSDGTATTTDYSRSPTLAAAIAAKPSPTGSVGAASPTRAPARIFTGNHEASSPSPFDQFVQFVAKKGCANPRSGVCLLPRCAHTRFQGTAVPRQQKRDGTLQFRLG